MMIIGCYYGWLTAATVC